MQRNDSRAADQLRETRITPNVNVHAEGSVLVEAGRTIFLNGIPARGVRACASCHGEKAEGAAAFPRLAGQRSDYVYAQLKEFGTALRPHGVLMREETKPLLPTEMRALAEYVQSL